MLDRAPIGGKLGAAGGERFTLAPHVHAVAVDDDMVVLDAVKHA